MEIYFRSAGGGVTRVFEPQDKSIHGPLSRSASPTTGYTPVRSAPPTRSQVSPAVERELRAICERNARELELLQRSRPQTDRELSRWVDMMVARHAARSRAAVW